MDDPPVEAGAVQVTVAVVPERDAVPIVGALGTVVGVMLFEDEE